MTDTHDNSIDLSRLLAILPSAVRKRLEPLAEAVEILTSVRDPRVLRSLGPSAVRGQLLQLGKNGKPTRVPAAHDAYFDWTYPKGDHPGMLKLYAKAKEQQWDGATYLDWDIEVDPLNPEVPSLPPEFVNIDGIRKHARLDKKESHKLLADILSWQLSQFLHGEQGALFAAAQVTEAVEFFDGKLYGATQVVDEARHVEVFHRYLDTKLEKRYDINDNLFVIIDALMADGRWDMKFLGMQIMVEGLALGAFGTLYKLTKEPLLKELLRNVIRDEARHVHYGVLALRDHMHQLSERERREREDWVFEVALLMRNRFLAYEVYEEWFEGLMTRKQWREIVKSSPGMAAFRHTMFRRLVPNLRDIGLLSDRIIPHYNAAGLGKYMAGKSARELSESEVLRELDEAA